MLDERSSYEYLREIAHVDPTATRFASEKMLGLVDRLHADALADDGAARNRRCHARNLGSARIPDFGTALLRLLGTGCVYRKLNPNVLMMKSAQDGVRTYDAGSLDRTRDRRILVQRPMRSNAVIIGRIVFQNAAQMHLAQYNDVVQTFPPDRSDQPFGKAVLPSRLVR